MTTYTHILDLAEEAEPPADGILSRTIHQEDRINAVIFGFGQGLVKPGEAGFRESGSEEEAEVGLGH